MTGPFMGAGATLCWGLDNNLTQKVSAGDPVQIAMLKGLAAGSVNTAIALALGTDWPTLPRVGAALVLGFLSYGVSLVFFVLALRHLDAAHRRVLRGSAIRRRGCVTRRPRRVAECRLRRRGRAHGGGRVAPRHGTPRARAPPRGDGARAPVPPRRAPPAYPRPTTRRGSPTHTGTGTSRWCTRTRTTPTSTTGTGKGNLRA